ncbi:MAG: FG-GAP repeat protein [Nitratireductor sp.]|nr:FG-GAP repeat protein [Nitratireductor sp.]
MTNPAFGTFANLTAAYTFNGDNQLDNFGVSVASAGDVNGDGFDDLLVGAVRDDNNLSNSGSVRVISGFNGSVLYTVNGNSTSDNFGTAVAGVGDINGDGFDDFIAGGYQLDSVNGPGVARVISGYNGSTLFTFNGSSARSAFGASVAGIGDVNGDEIPDLLVGAYSDDNNTLTDNGLARVLSGANGSVLYSFTGENTFDLFGTSVAAVGDMNGDGVPDLAVGAPNDDNAGPQSGSVRLLSGIDGSALDTFIGDSSGDFFGYSVAGAGDVNGDGVNDIIVGAYGDDNNALVNSGSARVLSGVDGTVLHTFNGDGAGDQFGWSVSGAGDVNGDGFADLIVGAFNDDNNGSNSGSARVLSGLDGSTISTFLGDGAGDFFGWSVAGAGDVNGDGFADVIVGAIADGDTGSARLFVSSVANGLGGVVTFVEDGPAVVLDSDVNIVDADLDTLNSGDGDYAGSSLMLERDGGMSGEDVFAFDVAGANFAVQGSQLVSGGNAFATFTNQGGRLTVNFTSDQTFATSSLVDDVAHAITYSNSSNLPPASAPIRWTFTDDTGANTTGITSVAITAVDDPATPRDDDLMATDTGISSFDLFADNGHGIDADPDDPAAILSITGVTAAGAVGANVGTQFTLASGALLTVSTSGAVDFDANGVYEYLPVGFSATEIFTYELNGGIGGLSATVTITIHGADNNDVYAGTAGADVFDAGIGDDVVEGGAGGDDLGGGTNSAIGDTLSYASSPSGVTVFLDGNHVSGGDGNGDTINGFENIAGSASADFLFGDAGINTLTGNDGADWLYGGANNDTLHGGSGADLMFGEADNDTMHGDGDGDFMWGGTGDDEMWGGAGVDWLRGEADNDTLHGEDGDDVLIGGDGVDIVYGEGDSDVLYGEAGGDFLYGQGESDVLYGQGDNDVLYGGDALDFLFGGSGSDTLYGSAGNDLLWGGDGAGGDGVEDTFVFYAGDGWDTIYDYEAGTDRIVLSITGLTQYSQLTVVVSGASTVAYYDTTYITFQDVGLATIEANQGDFEFV